MGRFVHAPLSIYIRIVQARAHLFPALQFLLLEGFGGLLLFLLQPYPNLPSLLQRGTKLVQARLLTWRRKQPRMADRKNMSTEDEAVDRLEPNEGSNKAQEATTTEQRLRR